MHSPSSQRGYTLLFAVLTATLVLGVTVFILSVSKKQFALSNIARESMFAIYAADSGIECIAGDPFRSATSSPLTDPPEFICDGKTIQRIITTTTNYPDEIDPVGRVYTTDFTLGFRNTATSADDDVYGCAVVKAYYYIRNDTVPVPGQAIITSRGYNLCSYDAGTHTYSPVTGSPRTVERAMQLEYH